MRRAAVELPSRPIYALLGLAGTHLFGETIHVTEGRALPTRKAARPQRVLRVRTSG